MKQNAFPILVFALLCLFFNSLEAYSPGSKQTTVFSNIDLELEANTTILNPAIYTEVNVDVILSNQGVQSATGVEVRFNVPEGMVLVGGNPAEVSQGTFDPLNGNIWNVGELGPNSEATMTINFFILEVMGSSTFIQVTEANEADEDSSPGNGNPYIPTEDDEAVVNFNVGVNPSCSISVNWAYPNCYDNNTPDDPNDDLTFAAIRVTGTNIGASWTGMVNGEMLSGAYNQTIEIVYSYSTTNTVVNVADIDDPNCTASTSIPPPAFGNCSLGYGGINCTNNVLVNGGFEDDLNGWTLGPDDETGVSVSTEAYNGTSSLKLNAAGSDQSLDVSQRIPVADISSPYVLSFFAKRQLVNPPVFPAASFVRLFYFNSTGAVIGNELIAYVLSEDFEEYAEEVTFPANTTEVEISIEVTASGDYGDAIFYYDDFCFQFTESTACSISVNALNPVCNNNTTPTDPSDDTYSFNVTVQGNEGTSGWELQGSNISGNYGTTPTLLGPFLIADGLQTFTIQDSQNSNCEDSFTVDPPETCSFGLCSIDAQVSNVSCTPINGEWTQITFNYELTAENPAGGWLTQMAFGLNQGGDPDLVFVGGDFPASGLGSIFVPAGETESNIVFFIPSFDCSSAVDLVCDPVQGGEIDLELSMEQSSDDPNIFSDYSVTATLFNAGPATATGVSVDFPKPDGIVYQGSNEYDASQGTFNPSGDQVWTVGSLPPGATATLTVNFFLLASEDPLSYAQVRSANENDIDSSPNNGTPPVLNEDDEASAGGGQEICKIQADLLEIYCDDQGTPDNGTDDTFTLDLTAKITEGLACGNAFDYEVATGLYGTAIEIGPFNVNGDIGFISVTDTETDAFDNIFIPSNFGNCNNLEEACAGNILPNPGFELVFSNWVLLSTVSNTTQSFAGTAALQAQSGADERAMYQVIDITEGQSYEVSAYVNENNGEASIYYRYMDAAGNVLAEPLMQVTPLGEWNQYTSISTAPAGTVGMEVGGRASAQTQVIFDAFCVRPVEQIDLPDLILTDLNIVNPIVDIGDLLSYSFRIDNIGSGVPLGSVSVRAYFSTDNILSNDDVLGGNVSTAFSGSTVFPLGPLNGGTDMSPGLLSPGTYFLILEVDELDAFAEENENNNIVVGSFTLNEAFEVSIDCPADLTVQIPFYEGIPQPCTNGANILLPSYSANCPGTIDLQVSTNLLNGNLIVGPLNGNMCGPLFTTGEGTAEVTFTAVACGNQSASCSFLYTQVLQEETEISAVCGYIITNELPFGVMGPIPIEFDPPPASTTCSSGNLTYIQTGGPAPGSTGVLNTPYVISYEISDDCGNVETCSFIIEYTSAPLVVNLSCPDDIEVAAAPGASGAIAIWDEADFSVSPDNCVITNLTQTAGLPNGSLFPIGVSTVSYQASGNCFAPSFTESCSFEVIVTESNIGGDIDLELTLEQLDAEPSQWNNYSLVATLTNNGPLDASGVVVHFPAPDGVVYVGSDPFEAEQGTFKPFSTEIWNVGTLPAGGTVTLTVYYFLLVAEAPAAYAQVQSANENDSDSTPGNGTPPVVNEDDEASTEDATGGFVDLELDANVEQFGNYGQSRAFEFYLELTNAGTHAATGVGVSLENLQNILLPSISDIEASQGSFTFGANPEWAIGTLSPGQTVTLKMNLTRIADTGPIGISAQVFSQNESDIDSAPGNGYSGEDDEISFWPERPCEINVDILDITCVPGSGFALDEIYFEIAVSGAPEGWKIFFELYNPANTSGSGDGVFTVGPIPRYMVEVGSKIYDQGFPGCFTAFASPNVLYNLDCSDPIELPDLTFSNYYLQNDTVFSGSILNYTIDLFNTGSAATNGNFSIKTYISTDDQLSPDDIQEGIIPTGNWPVGFAELNVEGAATIPADLSPGDYFLIVKLDADEEIGEIEEGNNTGVLSFTVLPDDNGDPCSEINVTVNPGSITLTNMTAPILIQKIFDPSWNAVLNCSGTDCEETVTTGGLAAGTYFISIRLFDQNWGTICDFEEYVEVPAAAQSTAFIPQATYGLPVEIHSLRPNPSKNGRVEVMVFAKESRQQELRCYNLYGGLEVKYDLNLVEGWNAIQLNISKLTSGTYYFQLVGQQAHQMPIRLVVIRE